MRPGQDAPVLYPDDLLVHEGARFLPARFQHRLATRGMPAVPSGIFGDGLGHSGGDEAVIEVCALARVVPGDTVGLRPVLVPRRVVRAVIVDEVGRIGGKQRGPLAIHQAANIGMIRAVTAQKSMVAKNPQVACPRHRVARRFRNDDRCGSAIAAALAIRWQVQQTIKLTILKANQ